MPKATFADFIFQNPNCKKYDGNPDTMRVFDILSDDDNIISMVDATTAGKPALTPCVGKVEQFVNSRTNPSIDLNDDFTKQAIGRMVKSILEPFGYKTCRQKDLPKDTNAKYFKSATYYTVDPMAHATMKIVKCVAEA